MNLAINYDETRNVGNQLITKSEDLNNLLNNINNINEQISQSWAGNDASKYFSTVNEQAQYMRQLANTISEIGNYLIRVSNAYQNASDSNANSINLQ